MFRQELPHVIRNSITPYLVHDRRTHTRHTSPSHLISYLLSYYLIYYHVAVTETYLLLSSEGRRPLGRLRRRWENNIKMDLREVVWRGTDWIDLAEDRESWRALVNAVMNLRVP